MRRNRQRAVTPLLLLSPCYSSIYLCAYTALTQRRLSHSHAGTWHYLVPHAISVTVVTGRQYISSHLHLPTASATCYCVRAIAPDGYAALTRTLPL